MANELASIEEVLEVLQLKLADPAYNHTVCITITPDSYLVNWNQKSFVCENAEQFEQALDAAIFLAGLECG